MEILKIEEEFYSLFNESRKGKSNNYFLFINKYDDKARILIESFNPKKEKKVYVIDNFEMPSIAVSHKAKRSPALIYFKNGRERVEEIPHQIRITLNDLF